MAASSVCWFDDLREESVSYAFGVSCKESVSILARLSRDELYEANSFLDRGREGFSVHDRTYVSRNISCRSDEYYSKLVPAADDPSADTMCTFPESWVCFFEKNYVLSDNSVEYKKLLDLISEISDITSGVCLFLRDNLRLSNNDINRDDVYQSFSSLLSRITTFICSFKELRINVRKSVSYLVEALLLQLEHSLKLGCSMALGPLSRMPLPRLPRFNTKSGGLVGDTGELRSAILSVMNICNFVSLEELLLMFERDNPSLHEGDIIMVSSLLELKYAEAVSIKKVHIEHIVNHENESDDFEELLKKETSELEKMEEFVVGLRKKRINEK
ncbi:MULTISPECIES: hypothetical protein [Candidatus Ichthyocystis]|uniref:Putative coiled coil protein n=1 Tax=Candidatus Ichthyocystis hellenicum TaxID=1561003 RepID=A0A0S4M795_9BURK|nr:MULTISPECIES: hypothetical protein [Ichthyocystis]CUT18150.1 putative coiled coil protein [Candidatus Ichthyocystis hellenicum]